MDSKPPASLRRVANVRRPADKTTDPTDEDDDHTLPPHRQLSTVHEGSTSVPGSTAEDSVAPPTATKIKHTTKCSPDLQTLCRLIGLHSRPDTQVGHEVRLNISTLYVFRVAGIIDIGCNVKCIVLEEPIQQWMRRCLTHLTELDPEAGNIQWRGNGGTHSIFVFNWFSPKSITEYISLGLQMCQNGELDPQNRLLGKVYLEKAEDFLWSADIIKYLDYFGTTGARDLRLITCTGFSLGGAIAHAFVYLLRELRKLRIPMRVAGFGCPRIGSPQFSDWYHENVTADSLNIVLYDEFISTNTMQIDYDPVCLRPPLINDFAFHPNCYMLHKRFGTVRPLTEDEKGFLSHQASERVRQNPFMTLVHSVVGERDKDRRWRTLHGLIKYYEAMHGLGDEG
eukprot:Protomagalhaensia_wolfi_Nauph_80__2397@NODE_257_length_3039_cov_91_029333_g192_i0_p2_GENE_NODE_257_length_3039_cov_91_029333_g192_i0NODE_257_length_3039_cov_91_029333_g192_i0_p2_ORF_typecomplete_len396_score54_21Lipase_3/PF01764_25/3_3e10_NODE_257_length_3039_cov_91_029333_g192_i0291216